jgi:hypothetical protein
MQNHSAGIFIPRDVKATSDLETRSGLFTHGMYPDEANLSWVAGVD